MTHTHTHTRVHRIDQETVSRFDYSVLMSEFIAYCPLGGCSYSGETGVFFLQLFYTCGWATNKFFLYLLIEVSSFFTDVRVLRKCSCSAKQFLCFHGCRNSYVRLRSVLIYIYCTAVKHFTTNMLHFSAMNGWFGLDSGRWCCRERLL